MATYEQDQEDEKAGRPHQPGYLDRAAEHNQNKATIPAETLRRMLAVLADQAGVSGWAMLLSGEDSPEEELRCLTLMREAAASIGFVHRAI